MSAGRKPPSALESVSMNSSAWASALIRRLATPAPNAPGPRYATGIGGVGRLRDDFEHAALHQIQTVSLIALPEDHRARAELQELALGHHRAQHFFALVFEEIGGLRNAERKLPRGLYAWRGKQHPRFLGQQPSGPRAVAASGQAVETKGLMASTTLSSLSPAEVHGVLSRHIFADGEDLVLDFERSEGAYLFDARSGRRFLDFMTFFASNPLGYNHPKMKDAEFRRLLLRVAELKPSLSDFYSVEYAQFVETFARHCKPAHFKYAFFIEGGALAVENTLKVAFDWKVRRNRAKGIAG
jgi:hypothetical protein